MINYFHIFIFSNLTFKELCSAKLVKKLCDSELIFFYGNKPKIIKYINDYMRD